jgi:putative phage-type endonuclease
MIEQLSEEWFKARLGKVTASRVKDVMAKTKSGPAATRTNYMMELLCQRLTGKREESFTSAAMQRGTDLEPIARMTYELNTGNEVTEAEFIVHPEYSAMGASPDGFVGDDGLIEVKCPNTAKHLACIQSDSYDKQYYPQMQFQMACTGRKWCDFVSCDDRLPDELQLFVCRVARSEDYINLMMDEVMKFLAELLKLEIDMRERMVK